jgi:hypothetical protein
VEPVFFEGHEFAISLIHAAAPCMHVQESMGGSTMLIGLAAST